VSVKCFLDGSGDVKYSAAFAVGDLHIVSFCREFNINQPFDVDVRIIADTVEFIGELTVGWQRQELHAGHAMASHENHLHGHI
jgi:hypothetical protein